MVAGLRLPSLRAVTKRTRRLEHALDMLVDSLILEPLLARPIDFRDLRALVLACKACRAAATSEMTVLYLSSDSERYITKQDWYSAWVYRRCSSKLLLFFIFFFLTWL